MKYLPFCLCVITLMAALTTDACSFTKGKQTKGTQSRYTTPVVPGWVHVDFGIEPGYISTHRGRLAEVYDEYVGGLFDDDLKMKDTGWLKPTYGNRNLLWTLDSDIGKNRQQSLLKSKEEFQSDTYEFTNGLLDVANRSWNYVGYTDKTLGAGSAAFQSFIFIFRGSSGASVFYWGEGTAIQPQESQSVKDLLSELSSQCK